MHDEFYQAVQRIITLIDNGHLPNGGFHRTVESAAEVVEREGGRVVECAHRELPTVYLWTL